MRWIDPHISAFGVNRDRTKGCNQRASACITPGFIDLVPPPWLTICSIFPASVTTLPARSVTLCF